MSKLFYNLNGNTYYILFGKRKERALLCNIDTEQYVICQILEENNWWHGEYFYNFDEAYKKYKEN